MGQQHLFAGLPARAFQVIGVTAAAWGVPPPRPRVHQLRRRPSGARELGLPELAFAFAF